MQNTENEKSNKIKKSTFIRYFEYRSRFFQTRFSGDWFCENEMMQLFVHFMIKLTLCSANYFVNLNVNYLVHINFPENL